jgi:hypothetical protein
MGGSYGHIRGEAPLSWPGPLRALRPLRALGGPWEGLFRPHSGAQSLMRAPCIGCTLLRGASDRGSQGLPGLGAWAQGPRGLYGLIPGEATQILPVPAQDRPWEALGALPSPQEVSGGYTHVPGPGPSHTTRARIMCARASARAPAE